MGEVKAAAEMRAQQGQRKERLQGKQGRQRLQGGNSFIQQYLLRAYCVPRTAVFLGCNYSHNYFTIDTIITAVAYC